MKHCFSFSFPRLEFPSFRFESKFFETLQIRFVLKGLREEKGRLQSKSAGRAVKKTLLRDVEVKGREGQEQDRD
jgi:hypothetical protein